MRRIRANVVLVTGWFAVAVPRNNAIFYDSRDGHLSAARICFVI